MPAWGDLIDQFAATPQQEKPNWLRENQLAQMKRVAALRDRHVLLFGSAFLQKPFFPAQTLQITHEDLNALMACLYGMDFTKGLTIVIHTPGGVTNAAESIVAYLRSKFAYIEAIVPTFAMSAGTMICLSCDRIVMGRQSQLGPIDPQFIAGNRAISAGAVVDQFKQAQREILGNVANAHVWAPILQSLGPSLLHESLNALVYGERMVGEWLAKFMFSRDGERGVERAKAVAKHFNDSSTHKSHGRRIGREEAQEQGLVVEELEGSQDLQDAVLTLYHLMTIGFDVSNISKLFLSDSGRSFMKQVNVVPGGAVAS